MLKKIKQLSLVIASALVMAVPMMAPLGASVHAAPNDLQKGICDGVIAAGGGTEGEDCTAEPAIGNSTGLSGIVKKVINIASWLVGAVSVIMIIFGGFKYVTSGGNDSSVGSAKKTIMFALIGLVIVALAQVIVRFVLSKTIA